MSGAAKSVPRVSRQDALDFLGNACRNWTLVPPLSNDDADDVAGALNSLLKARGMSELYEALFSLVDCMPKDGGMVRFDGEELAAARAALAKARGEA